MNASSGADPIESDDEDDAPDFAPTREQVREAEARGREMRKRVSAQIRSRHDESRRRGVTHVQWVGGLQWDLCPRAHAMHGKVMTLAEARAAWRGSSHGWCDYAKRCRGTVDAMDAFCRCLTIPVDAPAG